MGSGPRTPIQVKDKASRVAAKERSPAPKPSADESVATVEKQKASNRTPPVENEGRTLNRNAKTDERVIHRASTMGVLTLDRIAMASNGEVLQVRKRR
ncbi:hypothetical protein CDD80_4982 [Ophiocordyceps camponoti-rufipedis]|uniref:Uncharacterized protein n=1 Tax=Ophiocordyceps camponoti-rufipedis TaxID=2004952 RepID=A0A2C5YY04_9HYPO|nr:hypothetical protein CDD80_4982 [Ophiocordyceps camponoti-rufipedis]